MWGMDKLALALVILVVVAGCSSKGDGEPQETGPPATAPSGHFTANTGAIQGIVTDDAYDVLPEATVGLFGTNFTVDTALDGRYSFSDLLPGVYQVVVSKAGFHTDSRNAEVEAGRAITVDFKLEPLPQPTQPYSKIYGPFDGIIGCSFGFYSFQFQEQCKPVNPAANGTVYVYPDSLVPITGAVFELAWKKTTTFGGDYLNLNYPGPLLDAGKYAYTTDDRNLTGFNVRGRSPVDMKIEPIKPNDPVYFYNVTRATFNVRAAGSTDQEILSNPTNDGSSKLLVDQKYTLYVSYFYLGKPIPDGYTALPPDAV